MSHPLCVLFNNPRPVQAIVVSEVQPPMQHFNLSESCGDLYATTTCYRRIPAREVKRTENGISQVCIIRSGGESTRVLGKVELCLGRGTAVVGSLTMWIDSSTEDPEPSPIGVQLRRRGAADCRIPYGTTADVLKGWRVDRIR